MQIGVMTFWYGTENYGMMLQCWALQQKLKQLGHKPYIIRFKPRNYRKGLIGVVRYILRQIINYFKISHLERKHVKQRDFYSFLHNNIELSPRLYRDIDQLRKDPPVADAYIAGSDQIWAQLLSHPNNSGYFLAFGDPTTKRIAYAPSFAMHDYPSDLKEKLKENLARFNFVSCREYDGVKICNSLGIEAKKVIDPTLLLEKESYLSLIGQQRSSNSSIFIYSINIQNSEEIRWPELKKLADARNKSFIVTPSNGYFKGEELFEDVKYSYSTISEWLSNIYDSSFVVTPSFHGIAISILLEKEFVFVPLKGAYSKGNNRILDLLKDLNLESRILKDDTSYEMICNQSINWKDVKKRLSSLKQSSLDYLSGSLAYENSTYISSEDSYNN